MDRVHMAALPDVCSGNRDASIALLLAIFSESSWGGLLTRRTVPPLIPRHLKTVGIGRGSMKIRQLNIGQDRVFYRG